MKFRRRTPVVEAEQFFPERKPWPEGVYLSEACGDCYGDGADPTGDHMYCGPCRGSGKRPGGPIHRLRLPSHLGVRSRPPSVAPGDWIIKGEEEPCKPDVFTKTYEATGDSGASTG